MRLCQPRIRTTRTNPDSGFNSFRLRLYCVAITWTSSIHKVSPVSIETPPAASRKVLPKNCASLHSTECVAEAKAIIKAVETGRPPQQLYFRAAGEMHVPSDRAEGF